MPGLIGTRFRIRTRILHCATGPTAKQLHRRCFLLACIEPTLLFLLLSFFLSFFPFFFLFLLPCLASTSSAFELRFRRILIEWTLVLCLFYHVRLRRLMEMRLLRCNSSMILRFCLFTFVLFAYHIAEEENLAFFIFCSNANLIKRDSSLARSFFTLCRCTVNMLHFKIGKFMVFIS